MVTVAFWLQLALILALLLIVVTSILDAVHYDGVIDKAALAAPGSPDDVAMERDSNLFGTLALSLSLAVLVVWLGVTLLWVRRGSHVARVLTWVGLGSPIVLGLLLCLFCGVFGFAGLLAFGLADGGPFLEEGDFPDEGYPGGETSDNFYDSLYRLDTGGLSATYDAITATLVVVALLCAIATAVLLVTGPANRFFRPDRQPARGPRPGFPYPFPPQHYATPYPPAPGYPTPNPWGPPAPGYPAGNPGSQPAPGYPAATPWGPPAPGYPGATPWGPPAPGYPVGNAGGQPAPGYPAPNPWGPPAQGSAVDPARFPAAVPHQSATTEPEHPTAAKPDESAASESSPTPYKPPTDPTAH